MSSIHTARAPGSLLLHNFFDGFTDIVAPLTSLIERAFQGLLWRSYQSVLALAHVDNLTLWVGGWETSPNRVVSSRPIRIPRLRTQLPTINHQALTSPACVPGVHKTPPHSIISLLTFDSLTFDKTSLHTHNSSISHSVEPCTTHLSLEPEVRATYFAALHLHRRRRGGQPNPGTSAT